MSFHLCNRWELFKKKINEPYVLCYAGCTVFHSVRFALVGDAGGLNGLQILGVAVERGRF